MNGCFYTLTWLSIAVVLLVWAGDGDSEGKCDPLTPESNDVIESRLTEDIVLDLDPPGALRGQRYKGIIVASTSAARSALGRCRSVSAAAFRSEAISHIQVSLKGDSGLYLECLVSDEASYTEKLFLKIECLDTTVTVPVYLNVVDASWSPSWRPLAVAPPDTSVADSTKPIILDCTKSRHPAGLNAMNFKWWIDDSAIIKGGLVTSTTLPRGRHPVILVAEDKFGYVSKDTMIVWVK